MENRRSLEKFTNEIICPKHFCNFDISINPFKFMVRCFRLVRKMRKLKPEVVHAHQTRAALIPLLAAKICHVPVRIYHNHGLPYIGHHGLLRDFLFLLEKINCYLATDVITVSPDLKILIEKDLKLPKACHLLGNGSACGIDLEQFPKTLFTEEQKNIIRKEFGLPEKSFIVLFCGRPVKRKGIDILFSAWEKAQIKKDKILLLAGVQTSDLKKRWRGKNGIKPLGFVSDMRKLYSVSDVVVLPSYHEGVSYTILEAFASFRTVIASDIPGNNYVVKNQINSLLFQAGDWLALKNKLEHVSELENLRDMQLIAREDIEKQFSREACLNYLINFYSNLKL
jgi:glycosyltransferase involved in cell wall biosynthesis